MDTQARELQASLKTHLYCLKQTQALNQVEKLNPRCSSTVGPQRWQGISDLTNIYLATTSLQLEFIQETVASVFALMETQGRKPSHPTTCCYNSCSMSDLLGMHSSWGVIWGGTLLGSFSKLLNQLNLVLSVQFIILSKSIKLKILEMRLWTWVCLVCVFYSFCYCLLWFTAQGLPKSNPLTFHPESKRREQPSF